MFNHIRKVPYVAGDGKGGISYFAGGFQNQFGLETQIVAAMCKSSFRLSPNDKNLTIFRRHPCFCNHLSCSQGPSYDRPSHPGHRYACLGSCYVRHVQLPAQHFPHQERWLPLLPASFLDWHQQTIFAVPFGCILLLEASSQSKLLMLQPFSSVIRKVPTIYPANRTRKFFS